MGCIAYLPVRLTGYTVAPYDFSYHPSMTDKIDRVVRANIIALAKDTAGHEELRKLARDGARELPEVAAAVEALIGGEADEGALDTLHDAFLNALLDSEPESSVAFDSGAAGGGDLTSFYELPSGEALVCSMDGWLGAYESLASALEEYDWIFPSISIEDVSELAEVPEKENHILIQGEDYHRDGEDWCTDDGWPSRYVKFQGVWMSEDEALDREDSEDG
jgi:hypothetical protein